MTLQERFDRAFSAPIRIETLGRLSHDDVERSNIFFTMNAPLLVAKRERLVSRLRRSLTAIYQENFSKILQLFVDRGVINEVAQDASRIRTAAFLSGSSSKDFLEAVDRQITPATEELVRSSLLSLYTSVSFSEVETTLRIGRVLFAESGALVAQRQVDVLTSVEKNLFFIPELVQKDVAQSDSEFVDLVFGQRPTALLEAIQNRANMITSIPLDAEMFELLKEVIMDSMYRNSGGALGALDLAENIRAAFSDVVSKKLGDKIGERAELWARTEGAVIQNDALMGIGKDAGMNAKRWQNVGDYRVRTFATSNGDHVLNDKDGIIAMTATFSDGSTDGGSGSVSPYNCLPPDQTISGEYIGASKVWYTGELIDIQTAFGRRFSATVNHPVLTTHGFNSINRIKEGDHLVCGIGDIASGQLPVGRKGTKYHDEVSIQKVFETFKKVLPMYSRNAIPLDFYKDGEFCQGNIDVVSTDFKLINQIPSFIFKYLSNRSLRFAFNRVGTTHLFRNPLGVSFDFLPLNSFLFRLCSEYDPRFCKNSGNFSAGTFVVGSNRFNRSSFGVFGNHFSNRQRGSVPWSYGNPAFAEEAANNFSTAIILIRQLRERFTSGVFFDQVINISRRKYSGHVYDLQSRTGLMVSNGVISKQCRCAVGPSLLLDF